jgi:hypothetical protein
VRKNCSAWADRGSFFYQYWLHLPVIISLQLTIRICGTWKSIIDKCNTMSYKDIVFNGYSFTNKCMTLNLTIFSNCSVFLNLNKSPYPGIITNFTAIKICEIVNFDILSQLYIVSNSSKFNDSNSYVFWALLI